MYPFPDHGPVLSADPACADHPAQRYVEHQAPVHNADIQFVITSQDSKPARKLCPGRTYSLQLTTPEQGYALLTTSVGTLTASVDACIGRALFDPIAHGNAIRDFNDSWTTDLAVPCAAEGSFELKATFASSKQGAFNQNTLTVAVDATCAPASCARGDSPPPTASRSRAPSDAGSKEAVAFARSLCEVPVLPGGRSCKASSLGYSCSAKVGGVTTHWTVGSCAPATPCTAAYALRNPSASPAQTYIHYAATYPTTGYVSVGFTYHPGHMPGTDAVIGWVGSDGTPTVNSYHIPGTSVSARHLVADADQWMVLGGASTDGGATTVCFSRPVVAKLPAPGGKLSMNWAVGRNGQQSLTKHTKAGGFVLDPTTGAVSATGFADWAVIHGVLMVWAWVVLAPAGILFARQKWVLGERKVVGVHWWFQAHRAIQSIAVVLFVAGFALAFAKLNEPSGGVGKGHLLLGLVMMVLVVLQVLSIFIRPHPDDDRRRLWNLFHWNIGRLTLVSGVVNVFLGILVYHNKEGGAVVAWYAVVALLLALWVVVDVVLTLMGYRRSNWGGAGGPPRTGRADVEVAVVNGKVTMYRMYSGEQATV